VHPRLWFLLKRCGSTGRSERHEKRRAEIGEYSLMGFSFSWESWFGHAETYLLVVPGEAVLMQLPVPVNLSPRLSALISSVIPPDRSWYGEIIGGFTKKLCYLIL
jgi:hypothetical protein